MNMMPPGQTSMLALVVRRCGLNRAQDAVLYQSDVYSYIALAFLTVIINISVADK